jgi:signal transduction histidine kinase/DNA-binding response OmpR family regulator
LKTAYPLNTLTVDFDGNLLVSSKSRFWSISRNLKERREISKLQLVDGREFVATINTQYNDKDGGLWLGTASRGLLYYHPDRFKLVNYGSFLFDYNEDDLVVTSFCEVDKLILTGTRKGIYYMERNEGETSILPISQKYSGLPDNINCNKLFKDSKGTIWVCTRGNSGLYSITKGHVKHYPLPYFEVSSMYETFNSNLYLCTNEGLVSFNPESGICRLIRSENVSTTDLYQLIGYGYKRHIGLSKSGVFIYDEEIESVEKLKIDSITGDPNFFNTNQINNIFLDSRGLLWFGTKYGLIVWEIKNNNTYSLHNKDGLVSNAIQSIVEDENHNIWISSFNGISRIDVSENSGLFQFSYTNYNNYDGIIDYDFEARSVYITSGQEILWGGLDGFNLIDLKRIENINTYEMIPIITKLSISGEEVKQGISYDDLVLEHAIASTEEITLKHHQNSFSLEFSALNYINPSKTSYHYKLEGLDKTWNELSVRKNIGRVSYTNLSHGTYRFIISASDSKTIRGDNYQSLKINITPPFWKTTIFLLIYIICIAGFLYFIVRLFYQRSKKKLLYKQKEELDQMKFRFFTNVSHELRTLLTLIISPINSIIKKVDDKKIKGQLEGIQHNANELLGLVNQLLDFRKVEMKQEKLNLSHVEIVSFVNAICLLFKELTDEKRITFSWTFSFKEKYLYIDKSKLQKILNNLLSNAFKFTDIGGKISLECELSSSDTNEDITYINISIKDNGCGISRDHLDNIFSRFYQGNKSEYQTIGSGIGLHLSKEYTEFHKGVIGVESSEGVGSKFTISLPDNLSPNRVSEIDHIPNVNNQLLRILLVEDNDEFRNFLSNELFEYYTIITANNGRQGLDKALAESPDLIISDIMMPEMDGLELCDNLKKNVKTSHIPVIILTARSSEDSQIETYKLGVDAYIQKPFNVDILLLRIKNILDQQEKRKHIFKKNIVLNPKEVVTTSVDEQLIEKALACVEENISNSNYSVEQFSRDMFMDRTGLYRKLIAIVGETPTSFIRIMRLKRSAQLLTKGIAVSEIYDMVGFKSSSYFSKCFQEEFGTKPSQYANGLNE